MSMASPRRSGVRALTSALALAAALVLGAACNYGFHGGGGFPSHIRTLYIEPFENETVQFDLDQLLFASLLDNLPRALNVRPGGREAADAILRGRIVRYDDAAQNFRPGELAGGVEVIEHQVRIAIAVELIDVRENVILWESTSLTGQGAYQPDAGDGEAAGRALAIEDIVQRIVDGAQSQW